MSTTTPNRNRSLGGRLAWILLSIPAAISLFIGIYQLTVAFGITGFPDADAFLYVTGMTWGQFATSVPNVVPLIQHTFLIFGITTVSLGIVSMSIVLTKFRKGERWAWFALWMLPVYAAVWTVNEVTSGSSFRYVFYLYLALTVAGLVVSRRNGLSSTTKVETPASASVGMRQYAPKGRES